MRYCLSCGTKLPTESRFCPDCGRDITLSPMNGTSAPTMVHPRQNSVGYLGGRPLSSRPTGITIITVLVGLGAVLNFFGGQSDLSLNVYLGMFSLGMAAFQIVVVYGLWYMKTWGGIAAIALYSFNILTAGVMAFLLDLQDIFITTFISSLVVGGIIIYYVNSKRGLFVN